MARSPNWTVDELILALDLYRELGFGRRHRAVTHDSDPIRKLSESLNSLGVHDPTKTEADFRNPNSVYMKLCNFLRLDPDYGGRGLDAGSKLDAKVWNTFASDAEHLASVALAIRANADRTPTRFESDLDDAEAAEGLILRGSHLERERSKSLRSKKVRAALKKEGRLPCEACGVVFEELYGAIGKDFIECHHRVPLSELRLDEPTRLADLALVCSNCHRMLHRKSLLGTDELRTFMELNSN